MVGNLVLFRCVSVYWRLFAVIVVFVVIYVVVVVIVFVVVVVVGAGIDVVAAVEVASIATDIFSN